MENKADGTWTNFSTYLCLTHEPTRNACLWHDHHSIFCCQSRSQCRWEHGHNPLWCGGHQFRMASREAGGILSRCNAFLIAKQCLKNIVKRYNNSVKNDQRCFSISLAGTRTVLAQNKVKICLELALPTDNAFADPSQASTAAASLSSAGNHSVKLLSKPAENPFLPPLW